MKKGQVINIDWSVGLGLFLIKHTYSRNVSQ